MQQVDDFLVFFALVSQSQDIRSFDLPSARPPFPSEFN
jgi:hypothetical protein